MEDLFDQEAIFERIRQEDRKEARQEGLQEGRQEGLAIALRELMKNSGYSLEKAMTLLAIPSSARSQYQKLLAPRTYRSRFSSSH